MDTTINPTPASPVATPVPQGTRPPRAALPADKKGWWWAVGRRKTAVARVRLRPAKEGAGKVMVERPDGERRTIEQFFSEDRDRADALAPLKVTNTDGRFDIVAQVHGGGFMGQAQSVRLAIARAILGYDPTFEQTLRDNGLLTRDARKVERKKYGRSGARKRFQFSKR